MGEVPVAAGGDLYGARDEGPDDGGIFTHRSRSWAVRLVKSPLTWDFYKKGKIESASGETQLRGPSPEPWIGATARPAETCK